MESPSTDQNPSESLSSAHLSAHYWRRRNPPVRIRIPQNPSAQLTTQLTIGDDGIPQYGSESLRIPQYGSESLTIIIIITGIHQYLSDSLPAYIIIIIIIAIVNIIIIIIITIIIILVGVTCDMFC